MTEEEIRLDQTKKVFEALADFVINGSGSYRYLIYDKLGFECKDYADLIAGSTITNAIVELEDLREENQKLKEQLDKYENPEDMTLMMMWCTEKVKDENEKLKKQLHEASITIQEMVEQDIECPSNCEKLEKILTQQKKFIKYLEDEIKSSLALDTINKQTAMYIYSTTLRKYKSIIGGTKDE